MTISSDIHPRVLSSSTTSSRALHYLPATSFILDVTLMVVAGAVAVVGRRHLGVFDDSADVLASARLVAPFVLGAWVSLLVLFGAYRENIYGDGTDEFKRVLNASAYAAGVVGIVSYLAKLDLSRGFFLLTFVVGVPLLLIGRLVLRRALHSARARGALQQRVVIAGGPAQVDEIAAVLRRERWLGYHLVGALVPHGRPGQETVSGIPVLGDADTHDDVVGLEGVDTIFFAGGTARSAADLRKVVWELEERDIKLVKAPAMTDFSAERVRTRPVAGLPLIHIEAPRWAFASRWAKRSFDIMGSSLLIFMLTPALLFIALRVKLHDRGPVLFKQVRTGRHGAEFACFKFRTMVVDAEARLAALRQETGHAVGLFKMKDDPRITGPGKWLRRLSLDELPQLFNVLRGDMSLVGPRPPLPHEVASYDADTQRRLRVRPGMTGLWQVSGRSDLSWEDAIRLDLYYIDNWSMMQDLSILAKTFGAVVSSKGAY